MTRKPQTPPSEVSRWRQVGVVRSAESTPRPTSFGAMTPMAKMKTAKHSASRIPGRAPAMSAGPTGTEAMPA